MNPDPDEHVFAAGVGLDRHAAAVDDVVHAIGVAIDDHERHTLLTELVGDDAADAAVAADDEVILQLVPACD